MAMITPLRVVAESPSRKVDGTEPESGNSRRPEPSTSGWIRKTNVSMRLRGSSDRTSTPLPKTTRFSGSSSLQRLTASAASPLTSAEFCQVSGSLRGVDATYFWTRVRTSANGFGACFGQ